MALAPDQYINREMSWLAFNQRVLEQANHADVPLLERLKFLAITSSNLDEFFMVRVGGLQLQKKTSVDSTDCAGLTVPQQLELVHQRTTQIVRNQYDCFLKELEPALAERGIVRVQLAHANNRHQEAAQQVFEEEIMPIISPMAVFSETDFPLLVNHSIYVCVQLEKIPDPTVENDPAYRFVLIPIAKSMPRFITLPSDQGFSYALVEDLVGHFAGEFFGAEKILSTIPFRITRNADLGIQEDSAADLLHGMKELLQLRKTADCVRLEIAERAPREMIQFLQKCLSITSRETVLSPEPIDLAAFIQLNGLEGFGHLRDPSWPPQRSPKIDPAQSMFTAIAEGDILLSHPYESFQPLIRLIEEAAEDPDVLAIKQTLYRTSRNSPIVAALRRAAERGKYVTAIVELKARFDEARNIEWARELEEAQVQVIYGVKNLKTHAKVCIIVRREPRGIVRYIHFGTGNYNEVTARFYGDISYLTCNAELGADAGAFFNAVTGYSQPRKYSAIASAPIDLRKRLLTLIDSETERKKQGQRGLIMAKLNALVDPALIEALYRASQAGVTVKLNIRGVCCLRPGVPGMSENITVTSIIDRNLEHARMVYFYHGGDELAFISSADWMPRNLDRRIELLVPILDKACSRRFIEILESFFTDTTNTWYLQPDGTYNRHVPAHDEPRIRIQEKMFHDAVNAIKEAENMRRTVFEPHQSATNKIE